MKQQLLFKHENLAFGGDLLHNKRKTQRPLPPKTLIHLVLRADITQSGSLLKHREFINQEFIKWSKKYEIIIEDFALCSNHIHASVKHTSAEKFKSFIRVITGRLAQTLKLKWEQRPFTRPVQSGRPQQILKKYILQNHEEAIGLRPYTVRGTKKVSKNQVRDKDRDRNRNRVKDRDKNSELPPREIAPYTP